MLCCKALQAGRYSVLLGIWHSEAQHCLSVVSEPGTMPDSAYLPSLFLSTMKLVLLIIPFCRQGNQGSGGLGHLPQIPELADEDLAYANDHHTAQVTPDLPPATNMTNHQRIGVEVPWG